MEPPGIPHEAWFFVLAYLPLQQLITISQVCKSFRDAFNNDPLLWLDIIVEESLSFRLTEEILMKISSKANRRLRCLAVLDCFWITDEGLMSVVNQNPFISKLYVPGCSRLTPEGIIRATKVLSSSLTTLKINNIYFLNQDHLQTLKSSLPPTKHRNPRFYHKYTNSSFKSLDKDSSPIDVEICPKCKEVRLLFDCPKDTCGCQGCTCCILRCEGCGACFDDKEKREVTICGDYLCSKCWLQLPKCNNCDKPYCPRHASAGDNGSMSFVCSCCVHRQNYWANKNAYVGCSFFTEPFEGYYESWCYYCQRNKNLTRTSYDVLDWM